LGIVWLAHDEELERDVALKFLPDLIITHAAVLSDLKRETRRCHGTYPQEQSSAFTTSCTTNRSGCISMEYIDATHFPIALR